MKKRAKREDAEFLTTARERYTYAMQSDSIDRMDAVDDVRMAAGCGKQWDSDARKRREDVGRPVLEWNRLTGFIAQVVNDGRQNKPAVKVTVMDGGEKQTAEFYQGRIRHIEYESDADIAYDTAREHQVTCGRGFYKVTTEYKSCSFDQELKIKRIENPFSVVWDPAAREYDCSDGAFWFVISRISKEQFKRDYGEDRDAVRADFYTDGENPAPDWIGVGEGGELVQIAEYWTKEFEKRTLCQLADGSSCWLEDVPEGAQVIQQRECDEPKIKQYVINGVEVLDETEWLGTIIPIVPVWGKELVVEGKRRTLSLIRPAKDPQKLVNLYVSNIAEQIAMMPKTPYVVAEGQIDNHEDEWENINNSPRSFVYYKPMAINGELVGPPQRNLNEPPIQALTIGLGQAVDGIKAACNIYDSSLGNKSNETSGVAIQRRQKESDVSNFHFADNEARSRKTLGRILLELIPVIDKGPRTVATRSEDEKTKVVKVNQLYQDEETGQPVYHDLNSGSYSVAISTGPSFTSQRQEAFDVYSQIANGDKGFMQIAGDLLFRNLDAPGSDQIADRYEKILPPALQPQANQQAPIPPQVQAQLQGMNQMHDQLVQRIHELTDVIKNKQVENDAKLQIVEMQEDTKRTIALATLNQQQGIALLEQDIASIRHRLDMVGGAVTQAAAQQHEVELQQGAQQHEAAMAQQQQAHQAGMQQSAQDAAAQQQEQAQQQDQQQPEEMPKAA